VKNAGATILVEDYLGTSVVVFVCPCVGCVL